MISYLAIPYTHRVSAISHLRYKIVTLISVILTKNGESVFSPITQSHVQVEQAADAGMELGSTWEEWAGVDADFLAASGKVFLVHVDGVSESIGVQAELDLARKMDIPVVDITFNEDSTEMKIGKGKSATFHKLPKTLTYCLENLKDLIAITK